MSSTIESDDKIWNIFLGYANLISAEASRLNMDVYGTEQRTNIATSLTISHMLDHVVCQMKDLQKQAETAQRSRHNIKSNRDFQVI